MNQRTAHRLSPPRTGPPNRPNPRQRPPVGAVTRTALVSTSMPALYLHTSPCFPCPSQPLSHARLYASQYPADVAGLVLFVSEPLHNSECWDFLASADQVRAAGSLGAIPLVVLTQDVNRIDLMEQAYKQSVGSSPPAEYLEAFARDWLAMQEDLAKLSSNSTHIVVQDTTHMVPLEKPESIVDAIAQQVESD
jgi:pimeloyl-ACP methyl ester carboxylesterase